MAKRRLKRQLSLLQIVMLGTTGTIGAEIFVLTGHAAGLVGPGVIVALILGGILSYSVALNYGELATTFPFTGGAMTYVREAWGANLLSFLVGALDCLSSTFYSALSAVGFAYSLRLFIPALPIVPTAVAVVIAFTALNLLGVGNVGNAQILLGGVLLLLFGVYVVAGFSQPGGFRWEVFTSGNAVFAQRSDWANWSQVMAVTALLYVAYVGFEVIADDAEEVENPGRNIPLGILISLTLCMLLYVLIALVTLGVVPWQQLAHSETALSDAAVRFLPGWGLPLMGVAGLVATLTTINTATLSATREAFTLSRDGALPRVMSRLSRFRTPYVAILVVGLIVCAVTSIGAVDFLSYISSSGYLFVLFWSNLAMIRLRKLYPDIKRPFKVPLFPLTAYAAMGTCALLIAFTQPRALAFGAGLLAVLTVLYYASPRAARAVTARISTWQLARDRILMPVANPRTAESLLHLGAMLAQASEDTSICVLKVVPVSRHVPQSMVERLSSRLSRQQDDLLKHLLQEAQAKNLPVYAKLRTAPNVSQGVLAEIERLGNVRMLLLGWPGPLDAQRLAENPVKVILQKARTNVAVLLDRGLTDVHRILVPVGGGPHSRLAVRLAFELAEQQDAEITALHCCCGVQDVEEIQDAMSLLREIIEDELGTVPNRILTRVAQAACVSDGIVAETQRLHPDLIVVGASEEWASQTRLFGVVDDWIVDQVPCSVLLVRRYELAAISWIRRQTKRMEKAEGQ